MYIYMYVNMLKAKSNFTLYYLIRDLQRIVCQSVCQMTVTMQYQIIGNK